MKIVSINNTDMEGSLPDLPQYTDELLTDMGLMRIKETPITPFVPQEEPASQTKTPKPKKQNA